MTLTEYARVGFAGNPNPHIYSSPAWYAHELGAHLQATGRPVPDNVRMGRGYRVRNRDQVFRIVALGHGSIKLEVEL